MDRDAVTTAGDVRKERGPGLRVVSAGSGEKGRTVPMAPSAVMAGPEGAPGPGERCFVSPVRGPGSDCQSVSQARSLVMSAGLAGMGEAWAVHGRYMGLPCATSLVPATIFRRPAPGWPAGTAKPAGGPRPRLPPGLAAAQPTGRIGVPSGWVAMLPRQSAWQVERRSAGSAYNGRCGSRSPARLRACAAFAAASERSPRAS